MHTTYLFVSLIPCYFHAIDAIDVTIEQGTLRGTSYSSRNGTRYHAFLGIPFARPPIGELRFEPPQPADGWIGVRDATVPPPKCIQKDILSKFAEKSHVAGQEDCLYLNVYTPAEKTRPLPVMVIIHGGGFTMGDGMTNPDYFMDYPVVIVGIQYRLHILGFLSTGDSVVPGNNGLKDQTAALKWVQKNIAAFGGDPEQVTIKGQSAGAASVHHHLHSPLSSGLFHRAIGQSGSALAYWAYTPRSMARHNSKALGTLTCCPTKSSEALVNCLRKIPAEKLVLANHKFFIWNYNPITSFGVVAEPQHDGAFITQNPWYHEEVNKVPWIIGINSADGGFLAAGLLNNNGSLARELDQYYKWLLPITMYYGFWYKDDETKIDQITETVKRQYLGDKNIGIESAQELAKLYTDAAFMYNTREAARRYKSPVYYYYYDHRNKNSFNDIFSDYDGDLGVSHVDELISLIPLRGLFPDVTEGDDFHVSTRMVKYWVNFIRNGNPNDDGHDVWTPVTSDDFEHLHITTKHDRMKNKLHQEQYEFWKSLQLKPTIEAVTSQDEL